MTYLFAIRAFFFVKLNSLLKGALPANQVVTALANRVEVYVFNADVALSVGALPDICACCIISLLLGITFHFNELY